MLVRGTVATIYRRNQGTPPIGRHSTCILVEGGARGVLRKKMDTDRSAAKRHKLIMQQSLGMFPWCFCRIVSLRLDRSEVRLRSARTLMLLWQRPTGLSLAASPWSRFGCPLQLRYRLSAWWPFCVVLVRRCFRQNPCCIMGPAAIILRDRHGRWMSRHRSS